MRSTYLTLLLSLTYLRAGSMDVETSVLHAATGSAVFFPGVKMDESTHYDLRKGDGTLVLTCHGSCSVRRPYTDRVAFFPHNGTTFWKEVRKEDSGFYQHVVNMSLVAETHLKVIDGVAAPELLESAVQEDDGRCRHSFICRARGDAPLSVTILWNKVEMIQNSSTSDNCASAHLHIGDPAADGSYSCMAENLVSDAVSPEIKVQQKGTPLHIGIITLMLGLVILKFVLLILSSWNGITEKGKRAPTEGSLANTKPNIDIEVTKMIIGSVQDLYMVIPSFLDGALFPIYLSVSVCFVTCRIFWYLHDHHNFCGETADWKSLFFRIVTTFSSLVTLSLFLKMADDVLNRLSESSCNTMNKSVIPSLKGMTILTLLCEIVSFAIITCMKTSNFKRKRERDSSSNHFDRQGQSIMNPAPGENNRELCSSANEEEQQPGSTPAADDHSSNLHCLDPNIRIPNGDQGEEDHQVSSSVESIEESLEEPRERKTYRRPACIPDPEGSKDPEDKDGRCLHAVEADGVALDKDRVANG